MCTEALLTVRFASLKEQSLIKRHMTNRIESEYPLRLSFEFLALLPNNDAIVVIFFASLFSFCSSGNYRKIVKNDVLNHSQISNPTKMCCPPGLYVRVYMLCGFYHQHHHWNFVSTKMDMSLLSERMAKETKQQNRMPFNRCVWK